MFDAYTLVARIRADELKTRIGIAAFIALTAYVLAPSIWPGVYLLAVLASQGVDVAVYRPLRRHPEAPLTRARRLACCLSAALSAGVYSSVAAYLFFAGGDAGKIFAMVQTAGGLLHVTLHMHHSRPLLLSAALPHGAYFLGMPTVAFLALPEEMTPLSSAVVVLGAMLYVAHLFVAVRQAAATTAALHAANAEATAERHRAERASAAKSDFVATVSHEIRTPMNAVISAANLLKRTALTAEQTEHVSMLLNAGDVLMGLLNDVLDISKIEAGKMTLDAADLELGDKLEALALLWTPRADAKGVRLTLDLEPDLPEWVRTDPLRLQQILFNLLSNAVKFTEAGAISLRAGTTGSRMWFEVQDSGCGVEPDALERLFGSFEQAEASTTRRHGGTGLGLAISRRLAELMGGSLTARSAPGQGSCFRLELPLTVIERRVEVPVGVQTTVAERPLSVLVAEDHAVNQRILQLFLEPLGWSLTQAWDGREAVEAAAGQVFDVILMDMQMPVMGGVEASRLIRAGGGPNAATPIVALTAAALDHHRQAWAEIGVDHFLTKPIQPQVLIGTLSSVVGAAPAPEPQAEAA